MTNMTEFKYTMYIAIHRIIIEHNTKNYPSVYVNIVLYV